MADIDTMTDLEFIDHYIEQCRRFVNPKLLGEADRRGLIRFLNYLPGNVDEAKAIARARMSKENKYFGEEEIDKIAGEIGRLEELRKELNGLNLAEAHKVLPIVEKMQAHALYVKDYFKPIKMPGTNYEDYEFEED